MKGRGYPADLVEGPTGEYAASLKKQDRIAVAAQPVDGIQRCRRREALRLVAEVVDGAVAV